jgi:hypothetical protein
MLSQLGLFREMVLKVRKGEEGTPRIGDYVIDPQRNDGLTYAFDDVVRGKARKSLPGFVCPECEAVLSLFGVTHVSFTKLMGRPRQDTRVITARDNPPSCNKSRAIEANGPPLNVHYGS